MSEISELVAQLERHNELYRKGTPDISDSQYDDLIERLKQIDPCNAWLKYVEPVNVSANRKIKLPIPMRSLCKVKNISDLTQWFKTSGLTNDSLITIVPKFDGLSLLLNQRNGFAYSRGGNDNEGQNCTSHIKSMELPNVTLDNINYTFGEFVFSRKSWIQNFDGKINPESGDKYKSPRNTAAGLLNRDEPSPLLKYVDFFRYGVDEQSLSNFKTYKELYGWLCKTFNQNESLCCTVRKQDITEEFLNSQFKIWRKEYYIDGLVLYVNDLNMWAKLGRQQTTGNPLYAIAYKHPDFTESFETTVKGITWSTSKSGALKPVINIETVNTGECSMKNPTGYNAGWVSDHNIAEGARVLVTRSGDVIPKILETIVPAPTENMKKMWDELSVCPHCGNPMKWNENYVELFCDNPQCPGINLAKIIFFFTTVGVENIGEETLEKIFNAGFKTIKSILDIKFDDLIVIDGFGDAISNVILDNMKRIKAEGVDLPTLMQASDCFKGIGKIKAQKILETMSAKSLSEFKNCQYQPVYYDSMSKTETAFAAGVMPFFEFVKAVDVPYHLTVAKQKTDGKFSGWSVCFSGFRDSKIEQFVEDNGGEIVNGVSKKTTYLIVKDINGSSSKITKAKQLGVPVISLDEFILM